MAASVIGPGTIQERLSSAEELGLTDGLVKPLVQDLHRVVPAIYWIDFLLSSAVGWSGLIASLVVSSYSPLMAASVLFGVLGFYRALCFVHELSHQTSRSLPWFEFAYNLLVGFPMLMPSFAYVGMHQSHHKVSLYGTDKDPEYLPFARSSLMTVLFALESLAIPVALLFRFLVLSPVGFVSCKFQRSLVVYASSLTMNVKFRREASASLISVVRRDSLFIFSGWSSYLACAAVHLVSFRFLWTWLLISSLLSFVNTMRTLGAHAYESGGQPMDRMAQLRDSIDTTGAFWTELWAPVGLRYHALHHYFPGIPYHSLPTAYRRISGHASFGGDYRKMSSPSLSSSLCKLIKNGLRKRP